MTEYDYVLTAHNRSGLTLVQALDLAKDMSVRDAKAGLRCFETHDPAGRPLKRIGGMTYHLTKQRFTAWLREDVTTSDTVAMIELQQRLSQEGWEPTSPAWERDPADAERRFAAVVRPLDANDDIDYAFEELLLGQGVQVDLSNGEVTA